VSVASANTGASPPVAITLHRFAAFGSDALHDTLDQPDIAPEDAGLHRRDGAAPDDFRRASNPDAGQLRRRHIERAAATG